MKILSILLVSLALTACGAKVQTTVLTDSAGHVYPYAVLVSYQGATAVVGFDVASQAETYAAEVAKDKTKTVRLVEAK
jgi:hypothetical protein